MSQLNICIITQYKSGDLVRRFVRNDKNEVVRDKHGIRKVIDRSPITHSRTITYKLLDQIKVPGDNKAGLLEKLKHALQIDLDIDFDEDELEVAWKNPRDFWGNTDVMCRIRTSAEMSKILECLRATHLLKDYNEDTLFLYLVSCQPVFPFHANMTSAQEVPCKRKGSIRRGLQLTRLRLR